LSVTARALDVDPDTIPLERCLYKHAPGGGAVKGEARGLVANRGDHDLDQDQPINPPPLDLVGLRRFSLL
jgi:hypothetical protein